MTDREFDVDAAMQRLVAGIEKAWAPRPDAAPVEPVRRPVLRAVTADNAAEFTQAPKRRGRPRKVIATGNVIELRPVRSKVAQLRPAPEDPALIGELSQLAIIASMRDLRESEALGLPMRMRHREHLAAAYRSRGYIPPFECDTDAESR